MSDQAVLLELERRAMIQLRREAAQVINDLKGQCDELRAEVRVLRRNRLLAGEGQCLARAHNPSTPGATPGPAMPFFELCRRCGLVAAADTRGYCEACTEMRADFFDDARRDGEL